jgi:hypothetical protein
MAGPKPGHFRGCAVVSEAKIIVPPGDKSLNFSFSGVFGLKPGNRESSTEAALATPSPPDNLVQ